jgi:hypothetical protein
MRLIDCELAAVSFVRDYVQFYFDGLVLSAYTLPLVTMRGNVLGPGSPGYRDALCDSIGRCVTGVHEQVDRWFQVLNATPEEFSAF